MIVDGEPLTKFDTSNKVELVSSIDNYEGQLDSQGHKHGLGRIVYTGSDMYEGEWYRNYKSGWGRIIYSNGSWYEGMFDYG